MIRRLFSNTFTVIVIIWFVVAGVMMIVNPSGAKDFFKEIFPSQKGSSDLTATTNGKVDTKDQEEVSNKLGFANIFHGDSSERTGLVGFIVNNSVERWFFFVSVVFVGFLLGRVVSLILKAIGRKLESRGWAGRAHIPADLASPAFLAIFTLGLHVGLAAMNGTASGTMMFLQMLYSIAAFWYVYKLVGVVEVGLNRIGNSTEIQIDSQLIGPIRKTLRIFVVVIAVLFIASAVFGYEVRAWLAGLGIAGLAVSLAAQDSLKNLFGSITILIDRPFRVGERIIYSGHDGVIEEVGFRSTTLRTGTGHLVTIPNSSIVNGSVENVGRRPFIRRKMEIGITYDTPKAKIEEALQIIGRILEEDGIREPIHQSVGEDEFPPRIYFDDMRADSLNIMVMYWFVPPAYWDYMEHAQRLNLRIFEEFEAAGIEFAFPTQTLYLAGDEKRKLAVEMLGRDLKEG
ncbi:MAG: mechanosensitive ion channel family protein [Pirellulales bacterium]|nr:mechanosensitive ion channel family protein [Pirellulales bacterium]